MENEWVCNKLSPEDRAKMMAVPDSVIRAGLEEIRIATEKKRRERKRMEAGRADRRIAREERRIVREKWIAKKKRDKKLRGGTVRGPDMRLRSVCRKKSDTYIPMSERV